MASDRLQKPVLVLNASYEPINICAARRALVLVLKGVASAEEESLSAVHSARADRRLMFDPLLRNSNFSGSSVDAQS